MTQASTPLLAARALGRRNPVDGKALLQAASLELFAGDHGTITGPSGAGKSVLMRTLALLDAPDDGEVLFRGEAVRAADVPLYRARVAYLAQRPALFAGNVEENLRLPFDLAAHQGRHYSREVILALLAMAGKPAGFLEKPARDLSGGEAQLTAFLRALQLEPSVLLLDEPTSALDPESTASVERLVAEWALARPKERATLWVTHNPEQAGRVATRQFRLEAGRLTEPGARMR